MAHQFRHPQNDFNDFYHNSGTQRGHFLNDDAYGSSGHGSDRDKSNPKNQFETPLDEFRRTQQLFGKAMRPDFQMEYGSMKFKDKSADASNPMSPFPRFGQRMGNLDLTKQATSIFENAGEVPYMCSDGIKNFQVNHRR